MDIKDKIEQVVYESKDGLFLLEITEGVTNRFKIQVNSRQIEEVIKKNPKLFVEVDGKIKAPIYYQT
jgi:hypothetical protein